MEKLKQLEQAYQTAMDWYYKEKIYEHEYLEKIGEYKDWSPEEIIEEICKVIKEL